MRKQVWVAVATMTASVLAANGAGAAPVIQDAIGMRLTENALSFVEVESTNRELDYFSPQISKPDVACYDAIGIDAFTLDSLLETTAIDFHETPDGIALTAYIEFLDINGDLWGQDSDTFDLCPSFTRTLEQAFMSGIVFTADVRPYTDGAYNLYVEFNAPTTLTFEDVAIDVDGFPDFVEDLVLSQEFVQDFLARKVNDALASKVPELLSGPLFAAVFTGNVAGFDYRLGIADVAIDANGANAFVDIQVDSAVTPPACVPAFAEPSFPVRGTPGLGEYGDTSMIEVALADAGVNQVLWAAWKSGFMCYDSETHPLEPLRNVLEGINPLADDLIEYQVSIAEPPQVLFEDGELRAKVTGFHMEASSLTPSLDRVLLFRMTADMSMGASLEVERSTNRVLFSLDAMDMEFDAIESEIFFSDSAQAEEDMKAFIAGFVIPRMQSKMQRYEVTNAVFPASDYVVMLDFIELREGHAVAGASLLRSDDPSINHNAPDTFVDNDPGLVKRTHTDIHVSGNDDDTDVLLYSWRLDGSDWSTWNEKTEIELVALAEGPHTFEVKSRDRWQNEDASPASITFDVAAQTERDMMGGCGCSLEGTAGSSRAPSAGAAAALLLAVAVGLSIRRRSAA